MMVEELGQPGEAGLPLDGAPAGRFERLSGRTWRLALLILAFYLLLTLLLTWPLPIHLTTHVPGAHLDEGNFLWNTWWVKYSLVDHPSNPFFSGFLFYPLGMSTALYTMAWLNCFLALPFTLTWSAILGTNVATLLGFALSGFAMYLLALDRLRQARRLGSAMRLAAIIAGVVYAFSSSHLLYAVAGQGDYVSSQWLPLTALYALRTLERPGKKAPLLAALFALLAAWTELNFVVHLLVLVVVILAFGFYSRSLRWSRALLGRLALAGAVFAAGFAPLGLPLIADSVLTGSPLVEGWGYADMLGMDLLGPLIPSTLHTFLGERVRQVSDMLTDRNFAFAGYAVLLLAAGGALAAWRQARRKGSNERGLSSGMLWAAVAAVFFVFALGPLLHILGQSTFDLDGLAAIVPLPYIIIHYIPFLKSSRVPARFGIVATMAAAMLVAFACHAVLSRFPQRRLQAALAALIAALIIVENMAIPLPLNNAVPPEPYDIIAADPGDYAIIQVPLGWRDGWRLIGPERTLVQAYQMVHEKRIVAGNTSRAPGQTFAYFTQAPIITSILNYEEGRSQDPAIDAGDRLLAPSLLSFLDVRYIVLHGEYVEAAVDRYVQQVLPVERVASGQGEEQGGWWHGSLMGKWVDRGTVSTAWVLYRVKPNPAGPPLSIDLGTNSAHVHQAAGWSYDEAVGDASASWVAGKQATALLRLDQPAAATLRLRVVPFSYSGSPPQRMTVSVNGRQVGTFDLPGGWGEYSMAVAAGYLRVGMNEITLSFAQAASPSVVLGSSDRRQLSAAVDWIRLETQP